MSKFLVSILLCFVLHGTAYAQGVAVVQSAAPTTDGGTQDFTSSGFGTPVCAMFFLGYGTANGTAVAHAAYSIGFSDFTNEVSTTQTMEDTGGTTDTGSSVQLKALITQESAGQTLNATAVASTITNGVRLTWADAPPSSYLVTAVMFNSSVVQNCAVGTLSTSTTIGGTASVSGLGWQPSVIIATSRNSATVPLNSSSSARLSIGAAVDNAGIVQYATGVEDDDGLAAATVVSVIRSDRLVVNPLSSSVPSQDVTSFDSGGFTVTTRDAGVGNHVAYLTMKLATGIQAKLIACNSPTSTGSKSCTGAGWTPQAGIFFQSIATSLSSYSGSGTVNESLGISAFTAAQSSTSSIWTNDGGSADTASITDSKVVRIRKDAADFLTATLTGFQADGVDLNYTVTDATSRLGALLLFQEAATPSSFGPFRRRVQ